MPFSNAPRAAFRRIYFTPDAENLPACRRALERLSFIPAKQVSRKEDIPREHLNQGTLFITVPRGRTVGPCPGSKGHLCCNYLTVDLYIGCSLGCTYCIMKSYLNFEPITVYADPAPAIARIRALAEKNPDRMVRVGSGETGDSLLLDPIFELSSEFIEGLADLPQVYFESKTKTDFVDHLLGIPRKGSSVISFSLNAEAFSAAEEGCASSIEERLTAAEKAEGAGYFLAFHFDPVVRFPGWKESYGEVIDKLARFAPDRVVWISLGTFRYTPALKDRMDDRFYLYDEFIPCRDGKYRYLQHRRAAMYSFLVDRIRSRIDAPVYFCMESADIWKKTRGAGPLRLPRIRDIFNPIRQED